MPMKKRFIKRVKFSVDDETLKMIEETARKLSMSRSSAIRLLIKQGYWKLVARDFKLTIDKLEDEI
jgi:hypothetical protein